MRKECKSQGTPEPLYFSRQQAEGLFGISPKTLANWASSGEGPRFRLVGRRCLYAVSDFKKWLESHPVHNGGQGRGE